MVDSLHAAAIQMYTPSIQLQALFFRIVTVKWPEGDKIG